MTKEEIIDFCEMKSQLEPENEDIFNYIIQALEQEKYYKDLARSYEKTIVKLNEAIAENPKQKHGKWIRYEGDFIESDTYRRIKRPVIECSICQGKIAGHVGIMKYCPNCGAKMEVEE